MDLSIGILTLEIIKNSWWTRLSMQRRKGLPLSRRTRSRSSTTFVPSVLLSFFFELTRAGKVINALRKIPFFPLKPISVNLSSMGALRPSRGLATLQRRVLTRLPLTENVHLDLADSLTNVGSKIPSAQTIIGDLTTLVDAPLEALRTEIAKLLALIDVSCILFLLPEVQRWKEADSSGTTGGREPFSGTCGGNRRLLLVDPRRVHRHRRRRLETGYYLGPVCPRWRMHPGPSHTSPLRIKTQDCRSDFPSSPASSPSA